MSLTINEINEISNDLKANNKTVEKIILLYDLLLTFNKDRLLKDKFVLKGGTALNMFYLDAPRLSIDIDPI